MAAMVNFCPQTEQPDKFAFVDRALAERAETQRLRSLQPITPDDAVQVIKQGRRLLNFSSNDYLGLSKHPALIQTAQNYTAQYGTGATASRLVTGTYEIHQQLEEKLAIACGREAVLLFNSGFQANFSILAALLDPGSLVLCDRLVHNSLLQGALASRAKLIRYPHNDLNRLEAVLQKANPQSYNRVLIVTETVFSMDGDRSDVEALVGLAQRYNAILYLDDAHAIGVLGKDGMGLAAYRPEVDLVVGTFGKAFGVFGAFVACSAKLRSYLVNCCPGFIYTTALPPAVIGAIDAALMLMPTLEADRLHLADLSDKLRSRFKASASTGASTSASTSASNSQIVPLLLGDEAKTLQLSQWLEACGILAVTIRPPTVAVGTSRIRFALSSQHQPTHLDHLMDAIAQWQ